jgi:hypothetical protein
MDAIYSRRIPVEFSHQLSGNDSWNLAWRRAGAVAYLAAKVFERRRAHLNTNPAEHTVASHPLCCHASSSIAVQNWWRPNSDCRMGAGDRRTIFADRGKRCGNSARKCSFYTERTVGSVRLAWLQQMAGAIDDHPTAML